MQTFNEINEVVTVADWMIADPVAFIKSYIYNPNGNTTTQPLNQSSSRLFTYDAWNRLVGVDYSKQISASIPTITPRTRCLYYGGH